MGPVAGEVLGSVPLPVLALAADFAKFGHAHPLGHRPEGRARPDGLQLFGIAHQNDLGARPFGLRDRPRDNCREPTIPASSTTNTSLGPSRS